MTKPDLRFHLSAKPANYSYDTFDLRLHVVYVDDDGKVKNPNFTGYGARPEIDALDGLSLHTYANEQHHQYGHTVAYRDLHTVEIRQLEAMTKAMRRINKTMDGLRDRLGYPSDFAATAAHLAMAIGVRETHCYGILVEPGTWDYAGEWRWMDTDGLRRHVAEQVAQWRPIAEGQAA